MPTLKLQFPGGRYHATPWGHHVNEGLIEWPPSPWRLLRAFIACGFSSQGWSEVPTIARQLIDKLAAVLPAYRFPAASAAHSRHFMPIGELAKGREKTTLVFDTWANVGDEELLIHWPCELNSAELMLLGKLATALGYLGRSESWVEAELVEGFSIEWNAVPCREGERRGREWEQVSLMAAIPPEEYRAWREQQLETALASHPLPEGRKNPTTKILKEREKAVAPYPLDLLSCLTKDTAWWKCHGWSQPPGSRRVLYWRCSDALQIGVPPAPKSHSVHRVSTVLLAITTASGNRSALPRITRTLPQAELFHRAIVGGVAKGRQVHSPELTGRDSHGNPLTDGHRHAHILPVDLDGDGRLDHVIIHAPMGLGEAAQRAIRTLRRTWTKGGVGELQLAVAGCGKIDALRGLPPPLDRRVEQLLGPPQEGARVWLSATPFVPPRFLKRRGANTLLGQINAELASRERQPVERLDLLQTESIALRHYVRRRSRGGAAPPVDVGYALRLQFAQPISGPLVLGYASHFGLGRFSAID